MAILTKTRYVLAILFGFTTGIIGTVFYADTIIPEIEIREIETIKEVETVVEKLVQVDKIKIVEVPKVVYEVQIKEVPVTKTRIVYLPGEPDTQVAPEVNPEELECMTLNIYREANNQSMAGQIAVARVVINRVQDRRYPGSPCDVIYDGPMKESWKTKNDPDLPKNERVFYPVRNKCQFSWYCDGKADEIVVTEDNIKWKLAQDIAYQVLAFNKWSGMLEGATHYHATYVSPTWAKQLRLVGKIDDHIFYRWD
jgi:spore germination cell wall hydrolase CwlJ-like protein|tara:strand:+ start:98 stop:859 length:762 start_codon:yes stop_codon:yes gene_type:complete